MEEQGNVTNNYDLLSDREGIAKEIVQRINRHIAVQLDRGMVWRSLVTEITEEMEYWLHRLAAATGTDGSTGSDEFSQPAVESFDNHLISGVCLRCGSYGWRLESIWDSVDINDINVAVDCEWRPVSSNGERDVAVDCEWRPVSSNGERDVRITTEENITVWWRIVKDWSRPDGNIFSVQALWSGDFSYSERLLQLLDDVNTANSTQLFCVQFTLHPDMREQYIARRETNPVAAAHSAVDSSSTVDISDELVAENGDGDELICGICHDQISIGGSAKQLPCNHLFHYQCTIKWFYRQISCPLCRYDFIETPSDSGASL